MEFKSNPRRLLSVLVVLALSLVLGLFSPADASFSSCNGDPLVFLSNGSHLQLAVKIETDEFNVQGVVYAVHLPPGVEATRVIYTGGPLSGKETVRVYNDGLPNHYKTDTFVTTRVRGVHVTATTRLQGVAGSVSGNELEHLVVTIAK